VTRTKAFIGDAARRKFDQVEKQRRKAEALQQGALQFHMLIN
jgi:PBP1b-binding outer membrane lipoprotein LpoB